MAKRVFSVPNPRDPGPGLPELEGVLLNSQRLKQTKITFWYRILVISLEQGSPEKFSRKLLGTDPKTPRDRRLRDRPRSLENFWLWNIVFKRLVHRLIALSRGHHRSYFVPLVKFLFLNLFQLHNIQYLQLNILPN